MKRILSACVEQTQKFETEHDYQTYIRGLNRKSVMYKVVDKKTEDDGMISIKIIRAYNNYPVGNYLN